MPNISLFCVTREITSISKLFHPNGKAAVAKAEAEKQADNGGYFLCLGFPCTFTTCMLYVLVFARTLCT